MLLLPGRYYKLIQKTKSKAVKYLPVLLIPLLLLACNRPVVITGKITNYSDSCITVNGKLIKVNKTDSVSDFLIKDKSSSGGRYFKISSGFDINIFAMPGNNICLKIDKKTRNYSVTGDSRNLNEQIIEHEKYFDTIKNQIDKLNLAAGEFGIFHSKVDSMFGNIKNIENVPETYKKYEKLRENLNRAKLYYSYAFNHSLINRIHYVWPENFNSAVPEISFDDSSLLYITGFPEFTSSYLDAKAKLLAYANPKGYTDNILTNIKIDIVTDEFKDQKLKIFTLENILLDHIDINNFGVYNQDDIVSRINKLGAGSGLKDKISAIFKSNVGDTSDFKVATYKKREKYDLKAYVFNPKVKSEKPQPVVCFFFSGGWYIGSPEEFFNCCRFFADKGYVAISFEYSIKGRFNSTQIESLQDVKSAIRWTRRNAKTLNIDPDNLSAVGWSAGGHLTACIALIKGFNDPKEDSSISVQPKSCILIAPCFEPLQDNFFYYILDNKCDVRLLSPTQNVKKVPTKFLCLLGTNDEFIPLKTATDFVSSMKQKGNNIRLIVKDGYHHNGFMNNAWYEKMFEFISEQ